jgi:hypothetical protein
MTRVKAYIHRLSYLIWDNSGNIIMVTIIYKEMICSRKDLKIPYGNFAVREPHYDDHDDRRFANYTFNELCSFSPRTANIFRKMAVARSHME